MTTLDQIRAAFPNVPLELRQRPQWVVFRREPGKTKTQNVPYTVNGKKGVRYDKPDEWATFAQACDAVAAGKFDGVSYVLTGADGLAAIDLDHCYDETAGEWKPWAQDIVARFGTYTETSPSGTGLHLFVRVPRPVTLKHGDIELYAKDKVIACTGNADPSDIATATEEDLAWLKQLAETLWPKTETQPTSDKGTSEDIFAKWAQTTGTAEERVAQFEQRWPELAARQKRKGKDWLLQDARRYLAKDKITKPAHPFVETLILECAANMTPEPILWEWPGVIPKGKMTVFAGAPGTGKGLVSIDVASRASTGKPYPDQAEGMPLRPAIDVCMMASEDDWKDTILPRLMAVGADLKRIHRARITADDGCTKRQRELCLDSDLQKLANVLAATPSIRLVIVDPISNYLGAARMEREQELRSVLMPIRDLAEETGVTFLLVAHFNKRSDVNSISRVMGAMAMTGVARATWLFWEDPDNSTETERKFHMLPGKINIAKRRKGLEYTIGERKVLGPQEDGTAYIVWGQASDLTAETVQEDASNSKEKNAAHDAADFLRTLLASGPIPSKDVEATAQGRHIPTRTLDRARKIVQVKALKRDGVWYMALPGKELPQCEEGERIL